MSKASNPTNALRNAAKKVRVFQDKNPHGYEQDPTYASLVERQAKAQDVYDKSLLNKMSDDEFMEHVQIANVPLAAQVAVQVAAAAKTARNKRKRDKQKAIKKKKKEQVIVGELEKIRDLIARELVIELGAEATTILALKKWKRMAQRTATPKFRARICK